MSKSSFTVTNSQGKVSVAIQQGRYQLSHTMSQKELIAVIKALANYIRVK